MQPESDNVEIMICDNADEVVEEIFESLLNGYQIALETSMKGSDFIFPCIDLLHYICHNIKQE